MVQKPTAAMQTSRRTALKVALGAAAGSVAMPALGQSTVALEFPTYQIDESFGPWWKALIAEYERRTPA